MLYLRPVGGEVEIRAIRQRVALDAACRRLHKAEAFCWRCHMRAARPVTGFALHVGKLWCRDERLKAAFIKTDDVTTHAFVIKLLALALQSRHGVSVAGLLPDSVLRGVAIHASGSAHIGRLLRNRLRCWNCHAAQYAV